MSYGYTASNGFATTERINTINSQIDSEIGDRDTTRVEGDCVTYIFNAPISVDNVLKLNNFNSILVDIAKPRRHLFSIYPRVDNTNTTAYSLIGRTAYKITLTNQSLDYIDVMAKMESNSESYSIRVVDVANENTIAEKTEINNTEFQTIDMGTITNMPTNGTVLEIYAKVENGEGCVYIDQLQFYYS